MRNRIFVTFAKMNFFNISLILSLFVSANGLFRLFPSTSNDGGPRWNKLITTFPAPYFKFPPPLLPVNNLFSHMPLTIDDALKQGFKAISKECSGEFEGHRYMKNDDPAVILLFDVNGNIAGIQTSYAESKIKSNTWYKKQPMFTREQLPPKKTDHYYTLTAYFTKPDDICSTGRSKQDVKDNPSASALYLKNGKSIVTISKTQDGIDTETWTLGRCFPTMGVHYWYNTSKNMDCDEFRPYFLLYNKGQLTGFGFAAFGNFDSRRYEHPPAFVYSLFMKVVPDCVTKRANQDGFTTLHVYLTPVPLPNPLQPFKC